MTGPIQYDRKIFAASLRRLMEAHSERQVDIARLLGVSKSTVSAYLSGEQMPRMDKLEALALHYAVPRSALIEPEARPRNSAPAPAAEAAGPALAVYDALNEPGRAEFLRYGRYLAAQPEYRAERPAAGIRYIKHYLVPAAAGYASPIEGDDFELVPIGPETPAGADFCINIQGDSMEPYIPDGSLVYVRRDAPCGSLRRGCSLWMGMCTASSGAATTPAPCTCFRPIPAARTPTSASPGTAAAAASASARCSCP